jgi:GNAT superfamily N-acetyltransferase
VTGTRATRLGHVWFRGLAALRLYRRLVLTERRLGEPFPDLPLPGDLTVRRLTADDVGAYAAFRPEQGPSECDRRLAEGQWCFATWRGQEIVSAAWAVGGRAWIEYLELGVELGPDEVYSYDLYTVPELRGRRITSATRLPHLRYLRERGYRRALATLGPSRAAASLQDAIGFRPIGWIGYVGVGPWRCPFCRMRGDVEGCLKVSLVRA